MRSLKAALIIAALCAMPAGVRAQPSGPLPQGQLNFVVPLAAGGPLDAAARVMAEKVGARIGRTIIVENKTGAGGNIGAASVARSKPDGLTWLFTIDTVLTVNPHIYASQGFSPEKDLIPVARIGYNLQILAVNARNVPAKTFAELLAASKTRDLSFASAGVGSPGHLAFEYLRMATGMRGVHVPYRGAAPALQDLVGGSVDAAFVTAGAILPHVDTGALRPLAVSGRERAAQLPDVPTAHEVGVTDFEARTGNFLLAPAGVDPAIRAFFAARVEEVMQDGDLKRQLQKLAIEPVFSGEKEAIGFLAADREKWGKVIAAAGIKATP